MAPSHTPFSYVHILRCISYALVRCAWKGSPNAHGCAHSPNSVSGEVMHCVCDE